MEQPKEPGEYLAVLGNNDFESIILVIRNKEDPLKMLYSVGSLFIPWDDKYIKNYRPFVECECSCKCSAHNTYSI